MEFNECVKGRFALTLKSSLLCAIMLMPASTLAQSLKAADNEVMVQAAYATTSDTTPQAASATTSDSTPQAASATTSDSTASAQINQQKIARLSGHIQRKYKVPDAKARHIVAEAILNGKTHQVDPELILAIIAVESTFKERAVSSEGARGLMQVLPRSHPHKIRDIGGTHALFDPAKNIHTGSRILVKYLDAHSGNLRRALLSYNGSLGSRSSFPDRVLRIYKDLRRTTTEG